MRRVFLITIRRNFLQLFVIVLVISMLGSGLLFQQRIVLPVASTDGNTDVFIVVDPGHGGFDYGVRGVSGYLEKDLVLDIARKLEIQLEKGGSKVRLTRTSDTGFVRASTQDSEISIGEDHEERIKFINHINPDMVLSLHAGYSANPAYSGAQVLYRTDDAHGKLLAESIQKQFAKHLGQDNRRAKPMDELVFKDIVATSVVIEVGFLSSPKEEKSLQSSRYKERLTYAIRCGIEEYLLECKRANL